jgi:hypothetical protein
MNNQESFEVNVAIPADLFPASWIWKNHTQCRIFFIRSAIRFRSFFPLLYCSLKKGSSISHFHFYFVSRTAYHATHCITRVIPVGNHSVRYIAFTSAVLSACEIETVERVQVG